MYAEGYKEFALAKTTFNEAAGASLCASCDNCVAECVNGLDIAKKMRQARSLFA